MSASRSAGVRVWPSAVGAVFRDLSRANICSQSRRTEVRGSPQADRRRRLHFVWGRGPKVGQQTFNLSVSVRFRAPPPQALARAALDLPPARLIGGPPSTSGQGHSPFKAVARVRIPLGAHVRAVSSVGRAPALQAGGRWFEPGTAHLTKNLLASGAGCCPRLLDRACPVWGRRRESRRLASPRWLASA
jgi:hypothetical protein